MAKCPHCNSVVKKVDHDYFCSFCDMNVVVEGKKSSYFLRGAVDWVDAAKSTKELMGYHTFDLLLLLRFCRQERRTVYQLMSFVGRFKHESKENAESYQEAYRQYDYWTKKTRVAESLVKSRIGTVPKAVSNQLLESYYLLFQDVALEEVKLYA